MANSKRKAWNPFEVEGPARGVEVGPGAVRAPAGFDLGGLEVLRGELGELREVVSDLRGAVGDLLGERSRWEGAAVRLGGVVSALFVPLDPAEAAQAAALEAGLTHVYRAPKWGRLDFVDLGPDLGGDEGGADDKGGGLGFCPAVGCGGDLRALDCSGYEARERAEGFTHVCAACGELYPRSEGDEDDDDDGEA